MSEIQEIIVTIWEDLQEPFDYLPLGVLCGLVSLPGFILCQRLFFRIRRAAGGMGKKQMWIQTLLCFFCITYITILLNMVFFSREPGSRTGVNMELFGTWGETAESRGYVIENVLLFLPFGILFPCILPFLRRGWACILAGCMCGIGIELVQLITRRGYCQLDDVVMNTLGAGLGWGVYRVLSGRKVRKD